MAINERLIDTEVAAAGNGGGGNAGEEGLILHLDANDVDSYDGDGTEWVDIKDHEYTPATNADEHFNTVLYAGNGSATSITGVGFEPELVWIKRRDSSGSNYLFDQVRGVHKALISEQTYAEIDNSGYLTSFDSDGFSLGTNSALVGNGNSYVAWCFKAGGAAVSNTDGTITSQVSANNDLGFSVVKYTGSGTNSTIGHGLDVAPQLIFIKSTSNVSSWSVFTPLGSNYLMFLNANDGAYSGSSLWWNNTEPTANVFTTGSYSVHNTSSAEYIAYCFASKRGVSKVGTYTGTGATNKVYTGFEPAFIIGKCSSDNVTNWWTFDNKREDKVLYPNLSNSEDTLSDYVSFNRDGFTLSNAAFVNQSGRTFIYYAVAKNTNEASLIPDTDLELHLDADSFPEKGEAGYSNTPSTWTDSSANSNNGTITGATFDSELGNWLDFDGVNDYVQTSYSPTGLNSITAEYWVNADVVGAIEALGVVFFNGGGRIDFTINSNSNNTPTASGNVVVLNKTDFIGNWNKVTIVLTGLASTYNTGGSYASAINASIYYNGEFINTVNPQPYQTPVLGARVGRSGGGYYFDGKIGQARIYSSALTQDQIRQNYNFTKPSYPNGYDGTISGATWNAGGYFDFDGLNDKVTLPSTFFKTTKILSVAVWVKFDTISQNFIGIIENVVGNVGGWALDIPSSASKLPRLLFYNGSSYSIAQGTTALTTGQWHHLCGTISAEEIKLYVNGSLEATTSYSVAISNTNQSVVIGGDGASTNYLDGQISDVKLYDKALSAAEVAAQFAIKQFDIG